MPIFEYAPWDGSQRFTPLAAEAAFDKLSDYLLEHGEYVLRQLERLEKQDADLLRLLVKEGYLEKDESGQLRVAPRGVRRLEDKALTELFQLNRQDALGRHETSFKGPGSVRHEDSKHYEYGDPVANLNLHETLKNALAREGGTGQPLPNPSAGEPAALAAGLSHPAANAAGSPTKGAGCGAKSHIHVSEEDFVVHETEYQTSCATVLLLDMSGSMARYGKFYHAKKVALALQALIRSRYAEDSLQLIGFYTYASPLTERELLVAGPKPVSIFDSRVFLRVHLDDPPEFVPEHFTNIQAGLRFARNQLLRMPAANKQIICITDGEPTAHLEGRDLILMYPPHERTAKATLQEVEACTRAGITLSTFALIEDYFYLGLVNFVDQMARASRGVAVYCNAGELGNYVLESFVNGRRARKTLGR